MKMSKDDRLLPLLPSRGVCCGSHSSQKGQVCVNEKKCDSQLGGRGVGRRIALTRQSDGYFASYLYI